MATFDFQATVQRAAAGDQAARDELVRRFHDRVRRIVHRELSQRFRLSHRWILPLFSTSDVVQDVLTDAIGKLDGCRFEVEAAFVRYLATIVRNSLISAIRFHEAGRRDVRRQVAVPDGVEPSGAAAPSPEQAACVAERADLLRAVLESFSQRHRALLEMRLVDGETFASIAAQLGYSSAETARQSFCDAQAKLVVRLRSRGIRSTQHDD